MSLQALEADMVPYLLNILEGRLDLIENPATTKAQIVKALKAMTRSILLGEKVNSILEKSSVWAEYKDQKHDLFISNAPAFHSITGQQLFFIRSSVNLIFYLVYYINTYSTGIPVSAGYLTAGPSATIPSVPPPVDREDRNHNRNDHI